MNEYTGYHNMFPHCSHCPALGAAAGGQRDSVGRRPLPTDVLALQDHGKDDVRRGRDPFQLLREA